MGVMSNIDIDYLRIEAQIAKAMEDNHGIPLQEQIFQPFKDRLPALGLEEREDLVSVLLSDDPDPALLDFLIKKGVGDFDDPVENEGHA